jgi:dihydropteroate synthase
VRDADTAGAAVRAGADLLDLGQGGPAVIGEIHDRHPGVPLAVSWPPARQTVTRLTGLTSPVSPVSPICDDIPAAEAAVTAGLPREAVLIAVPPSRVAAATAAGWAVMADVDLAAPGLDRVPNCCADVMPPPADKPMADELSRAVAAAAICGWLGVAAVRTRHLPQVRRALDMTASIRGGRPPAWAVRALA